MAGRPNRPYQTDHNKYANVKDLGKRTRNVVLASELEDERREKYVLWNTFFRRNPHRFCEFYLGIKLFPYQTFLLYLTSVSTFFVAICSRAAAKSFIMALYACIKCILWPASEVVIGSSTLKQSSVIISKVEQLVSMSPMLDLEIVNITRNQNTGEVDFRNGSKIKVVAANEGGKGNRATVLILDEFRLLKKEIVDTIFTPFLYQRQRPFKVSPKYVDYPEEEPQKISITSCGFRSEWWYASTVSTIKMMLEGKDAGFFCTDYLVSVFHKIKTKRQMEIEEEQSDPVSFDLEYRNLPAGQSGKAYFKPSMFNRNIKRAFYPFRDDLVPTKKNPYAIQKEKEKGEIRVVGVDIASRANKANDNSIIVCVRLLPTKKGYERSVVYIESAHGKNTISQSLRIKQIFYDFESDYLVLDVQNAGIGVFDSMSSVTRDDARGRDYPAFTVMESSLLDEKVKEEFRNRTLGMNAEQVVFPISASAKTNSEIAVSMRSALQKKLFNFLISDLDAEDFLVANNKEFFDNKEDISIRAFLLHPFVQTNLAINEFVNLEMNLVNGVIKLDEGTGWKDRYTAISYLNWFVSESLDRMLLRQDDTGDEWDLIQQMTFVG